MPSPAAVALCLTGTLRAASRDPARLLVQPLQHVVLAPFAAAGYHVDIFLATSASECLSTQRALEPLQLQAVACIDEQAFTEEEARWLQSGPWASWSREAFLGQLKKVRHCADMIQEASASATATYRLVARQRLDILWHRFPRDVATLEIPGIVWVPWRATDAQAQYINDRYAIGGQTEMLVYLRVYDQLLDPKQDARFRYFEATSDGLDTEEVWESVLRWSGILARQHRGICFNMLRRPARDAAKSDPGQEEAEDNCRYLPSAVHMRGYSLDDVWTKVPLVDLPGQYEYDPLLAARLLHFWFAERARAGRPMKVMELGCGRASMMERWPIFHSPSFICVDPLPGLREVLGDDVLPLDFTAPLSPQSWAREMGCRLLVDNGAKISLLPDLAIAHLQQCCLDDACDGVDIPLGFAGFQGDQLEAPLRVQALPRNTSRRGTVPWASGKADWILAFDVLDPAQSPIDHENLLRNMATLAAVGVIFSVKTLASLGWQLSELAVSRLEAMGLVRDKLVEESLRLYARSLHHRKQLFVLRWPSQQAVVAATHCSLVLHKEWSDAHRCHFGLSFGCLDLQTIWVTDGCGGWFERGYRFERSAVACSSCWDVHGKRSGWSHFPDNWRYVECRLPEHPEKPSQEALQDEARQREEATDRGDEASPQPENDFLAPCGAAADEMAGVPWRWVEEALAMESGLVSTYGRPLLTLQFRRPSVVKIFNEQGLPVGAPTWAPSNVCLAWNLWPALLGTVWLRVMSLAEHAASAEREEGDGTIFWRLGPSPWGALWTLSSAEAVVRTLLGESITAVYDRWDPSSSWSTSSDVWKLIAWGNDPLDLEGNVRAADQDTLIVALQRMDAFMALVSAVRWAAAVAAEPHAVHQETSDALLMPRASTTIKMLRWHLPHQPWLCLRMRLLEAVLDCAPPYFAGLRAHMNASTSWQWHDAENVIHECGQVDERLQVDISLPACSSQGAMVDGLRPWLRGWHLQFGDSLGSWYLYHAATWSI